MKRFFRLLLLALFLYGLWYVGSIVWDVAGVFRDSDRDYEFVDGGSGIFELPLGVNVRPLSGSGYIADPERINILIIGVDTRPDSKRAPLSDSIMLLSLPGETGGPVLFSIPRDTFVFIPDRGYDKVNHSHAFGGAALLRQVLTDFLDVPIDYYLRLDFQGFRAIVDMMGGVDIYVDRDMPEYGLKQGQQVLTGQQALMFVRNRNEPRGDFARMERQQRFIVQVVKQIQDKGYFQMLSLIREGARHVDTDMPLLTLLAVTRDYWDLDVDDVNRYVLPGRAFIYEGIYYLEANHSAGTKFINENLRVPVEGE